MRILAEQKGETGAQSRHLSQRQIDKNNAALKHVQAQVAVGQDEQHAHQERRQ